jgi:hypothetical protein
MYQEIIFLILEKLKLASQNDSLTLFPYALIKKKALENFQKNRTYKAAFKNEKHVEGVVVAKG